VYIGETIAYRLSQWKEEGSHFCWLTTFRNAPHLRWFIKAPIIKAYFPKGSRLYSDPFPLKETCLLFVSVCTLQGKPSLVKLNRHLRKLVSRTYLPENWPRFSICEGRGFCASHEFAVALSAPHFTFKMWHLVSNNTAPMTDSNLATSTRKLMPQLSCKY